MNWTFTLLILLTTGLRVWAYPNFVGFGYKTCINCHYNSHGNGPLNDYGKALFAAEIASRAFYDPKVTPEQLSENSGFPGQSSLPSWFRPGFKTRLLWFQTDPGSATAKSRVIPMQADFSGAFLFDDAQKWVYVATLGYMPTPKALQSSSGPIDKPSNLVSREDYLRYNPNRNWLFYLGFMDKVYGIRSVDHTAFSHTKTGLAQNDQSHGMVIQYNTEPYEISLNPFFGNLSQSSDLRQQGASLMVEKDLAEKHRVGGAVLTSKNQYINWTRAEVHSKLGFGQGNSFLTELGIIQDKPISDKASNGGYAYIESTALLTRGYNLLSQIEYFNQTLSTQAPDQIRWTFGLLMFPAPRYELRTTFVSGRTQSDSGVSADQWQLQAQLHISL